MGATSTPGSGTALSAVVLSFSMLVCSPFVLGQQQTEPPQDKANPQVPTIAEFVPKSMLQVPETPLRAAKFPCIDIHTHFGFRLKGDTEALARYVDVMNRNNITLSISLDATLGREERHVEFLQQFEDRILTFCHIDFIGSGDPKTPKSMACNQVGFVARTCRELAAAKKKGIVGLKFFKQFGLGYRNADGSLIAIDDVRFDPIWETCGRLELPVIIHTGDPAAFFEPIDVNNERYEELLRHPDWSFYGDSFPSRNELLQARNRVIARHPKTKFLGAHMAGNPEDLATVSQWLDALPNLYIEISSRIGELGRQPYSARKFFLKYSDRILFGTDGPWPEARLSYYWRFLESQDEYFPYSEKRPQPQGLWFIYGLDLPDQVLRKVYYENALNLIPALKLKYRN